VLSADCSVINSSGNMQRLPISHNTTTGTGVLLSLAGTAAASWRHVLQAAAHSRLELLPLEMPGRRRWNVASVALATSWCRWNANDGALEHRQWAGDCQLGRLALCRAHSGKPEHITGIARFSLNSMAAMSFGGSYSINGAHLLFSDVIIITRNFSKADIPAR